MTEKDQNAAIGRMVSRFSEAKKRRAALMSEADDFAREFDVTAKTLRSLSFKATFSDGHDRGYHQTAGDVKTLSYPLPDRVNALVDELRTVSAEIRDLRLRLKEAGLNVE